MKSLRAFEIVKYLEKRKYCPIQALMTEFNVSEPTIRRDISMLVKSGRLRKVHGGVASNGAGGGELESGGANFPAYYRERLSIERARKEKIARKAAGFVEEGDLLFLDSSTTAYYLSRKLQKSSFANLTIITNSVLIIQEFTNFPSNFSLVAVGGCFDLQFNAFLGGSALREVADMKIGKAFVSALAVNGGGAFSRHEGHTVFLQTLLRISGKKYLIADATKFGKSGLYEIGPLNCFDAIISDSELPEYASSGNGVF